MKTKKIPAIIMLSAGSVTCIATYLNHYSLKEMLIALIIVLVIFLIVGYVIKMVLDSFELPEEDEAENDGEVVEKQNEDETQVSVENTTGNEEA